MKLCLSLLLLIIVQVAESDAAKGIIFSIADVYRVFMSMAREAD